jgi:hypothetical protein
MKYLVNYANRNFYASQARLNASAMKFGIDQVFSYQEKDIIGTEFYKKNQEILNQPKGAGFWIWKPYIILDVLSKIKENDIVVYSDSGIEIIGHLDPLFELCHKQGGILLFQTHVHLNRTWTKRDCFVLMGCDSSEYWEAQQLMGGFSIFMKNERSIKFVEEWLYYCCNKFIITDIPNVCGLENLPDFLDHRHDQSVLSILDVKHNIEVFRDPSQWGNRFKIESFRVPNEFTNHGQINVYSSFPYSNSPYGTLLNLHRQRH